MVEKALTSHHERDGVARALPLGICGHTGELPGSSSRHALQHQAVVAQDNSGGDIMKNFAALRV